MSKKAMAPYALFMVAVIGIFLFFAMAYLSGWIGTTSCEALAWKCSSDQKAFCLKWWTNSGDFKTESKPDWKASNVCKDKDSKDTIPCQEPTADECRKST